MSDYISREQTLALLKSLGSRDYRREKGTIQDAIKMISSSAYTPAADVAEVVRCKNCKWFADNNGGEWYGCKMFHVVRITPEDAPKPDDFCRYGERMDGAAE